MNVLERAIQIAVDAHEAQTDKAGTPYIRHPLRVMEACPTAESRVVAVLHDVVEDSDWTFDRLRDEGFDDAVLTALDHLTKRDGEDYDEFVARAATHPVAREVKRADIRDNLDVTRLDPPVGEDDRERIEKYLRALERLDAADDDHE